MDNRKLIVAAACLLGLNCLLTGIPLVGREWVLVLGVGCFGALWFSYTGKGAPFMIFLTTAYLILGMHLPRWLAGRLPGDKDTGDHFAAGFLLFLGAACLAVFFVCCGKFLRFVVDTRKQRRG